MKKKIAVLASGSGSNLQAILDALDRGEILDSEVVLVISDRKEAYALERAKRRNIPIKYLRAKDYASREEFDRKVVCLLEEAQTDLVVLAGYMRIITPVFFLSFKQRQKIMFRGKNLTVRSFVFWKKYRQTLWCSPDICV